MQAVHRSASLLALVFLAGHIATMVIDPFAQIRLVDVLLPFTAAWRPFAVGLGTVAFDIVLALVATGLLRQRIPQRAWRLVHWAAYLMWPAAATHALLAGTDAGQTWLLAIWGCCLAVVLAAAGWRCAPHFQDRSVVRRRTPAVGPVAR